jgi:hypothetical protein
LRTRQLTSEEGRVVALRVSGDGQQAAYAVAEKVVRVAQRSTALRGVTLVILDLRQLQPLGRQRLEGDLERLDLGLTAAHGFWFASRVPGSLERPHLVLRFERGGWRTGGPAPDPDRDGSPVTLTPAGVAPTKDWHEPGGTSPSALAAGGCRVQARDAPDGTGAPAVEIRPLRGNAPAGGGGLPSGRGRLLRIGGPHGAGLTGLPL